MGTKDNTTQNLLGDLAEIPTTDFTVQLIQRISRIPAVVSVEEIHDAVIAQIVAQVGSDKAEGVFFLAYQAAALR